MLQLELPKTPKFETFSCKYYEMQPPGFSSLILAQVLKEAEPSLDDMVYLKNDFEINQSISSDCSMKALDMVLTQSGFVVFKEYFDGIPLVNYISNKEFTVPLFLQLAIRLTQLLKELHQRKILVKEFVIEDILISPETLNMKMCTLGSASRVLRERPEFNSEFNYYGPLWHIAPEQTGRVGRTVDYRSDYYALGVILYQVLCWRKPFNYTDSLELIHAHIAKRPIEPRQVRPNIPQIISDIVMKLMAKNSEDRYQGEEGILSDLELCMRQWQQNGEIELFHLGEKDNTSLFSFSEKLYGRNKELEMLLKAWGNIKSTQLELFLVSGYSGIGKTRLINEIRKPVLEANGYFISGKFNQFTKEYPYSAFAMAFNQLLQQMLSESDEQLNVWKSLISKAVDSNGALMTGLMSDLEKLIGPQQSSPDIGAMDGKRRFLNTFLNFLSVIPQNGKTLVIFLDDLQWADSGSLELLSAMVSSHLNNIFLIGAYRDNEVDAAHPLSMTMHHLEKEFKHNIHKLKLSELDLKYVNELIADSLRMSTQATVPLAKEVMRRTRGNPFFVKQFIEKLIEEKIITFDRELLCWVYDLDAIGNMELSEYVVDLILGKLKKMSEPAQELIQLASCIGNTFDLDSLVLVSTNTKERCAEYLQEIISNEFISPIGSWQKFHSDDLWNSFSFNNQTPNYSFRFQHDRIQQAAYNMLSEEVRISKHLHIGKLLLNKAEGPALEELLFDILNHLNVGFPLLTDVSDKNELAELNLRAGKRALKNNAIRPAANYFKIGMALLVSNQNSELFKSLLISRSECEYLLGNYEASEKLFDEALSEAETHIAKADILSRKMALYENTQRHEKALEAAKQGLKLLDMNLPLNAGPLHVMKELLTVKFNLRNKSTQQLLENKNMEDEKIILTMKILMNLWGPCYLLQKQNLLAFKILRMVNLSIKYGNSIESALAFAFYGYVISAQLGDYKNGYAFAQLGMAINEKFKNKSLRSKVLVIAEGCVAHWRLPYKSYLQNLREAHHVGLEYNDIIYAGYAVTFVNRCQVLMGEELNSVYEKLRGYIRFSQNIQSSISYHQMLAWARVLTDLRDKLPDDQVFGDLLQDEAHARMLEKMSVEQNLPLPLANYHTAKAFYHCLMGDFQKAYDYAERAVPLMAAVLGLPEWPEQKIFMLFAANALLLEGKTLQGKQQKTRKQQLDQLEKWAENAPSNYGAKYQLAKAEDHLINNQIKEATACFENAARLAKENNMTYMSAYVAERMANMYFHAKEQDKAMNQLRFALLEYQKWGAPHKVRSLNARYTFLGSDTKDAKSKPGAVSSSSLDLKSVMQAAATLSEEVVFEKLLEKLLMLVIENAGAQNAYFIRSRNNTLYLDASSKMQNAFTCEIKSVPLETVNEISHAIIRKVFHTGEAIIVEDVSQDALFSFDPQLKTSKARSVLCLPILSKGQLSGILYLDNDASSHVFTFARLEMLKLLSGQMAVSLENAQLYQNLEQKVEERTATIVQQNVELEKEKKKTDSLLLNILPEEIANELKEIGYSKPKKHDEVSIMFTDFEGFTAMSEKLSPEEVVEIVDHHYKAFDKIVAKYNIEKIKTIGDAYMCVSGLPRSNPDHATNCILAAFEILEFVNNYNKQRHENGLPFCEVRIGIHTGPVVAGVVGLHKFAYDIWGDSVNTASRMESSGAPGKINVSVATYEKQKINLILNTEVKLI
ncbi:MAG: AAA family ATPase [Saprospiraceae bacterium]|nr:AAA family ATPase [Saprospiraceae bacterium]